MTSRGCLSQEVQRESEKFLGYKISVVELRLIPYIQFIMANGRKFDDRRVNDEERRILKRWEKEGHLEMNLEGVVVSKGFWDFMCRVLWYSYVSYDGFKGVRNPTVPKGQVWETESRKGKLLVRLLEDVNKGVDYFFQVEVLRGKAKYISEMYRDAQDESGMGMEGTVISMRTTLTKWIKRCPELELKKKVEGK